MRRILMALSAGTAGLLLAGTGRLAVADESSGGTAADTKQEQQIRATFQKTPDLRNDRIDVKELFTAMDSFGLWPSTLRVIATAE